MYWLGLMLLFLPSSGGLVQLLGMGFPKLFSMGLTDLTHKNTGRPVRFELRFFSIIMPPILHKTHTKIVYLLFRFNWASCIYLALLLSTAKLEAFAWFYHIKKVHTCCGILCNLGRIICWQMEM